jgi:hypothetical protein
MFYGTFLLLFLIIYMIVAEYQDIDKKIQAIQHIIERLPTAHQFLLVYLLDMLGMFVSAQEYTRMDTACLAAVFAPVCILNSR